MENALNGIYALVVFESEISLVRRAHSFAVLDFWYINSSCVNAVRAHFPWSISYKFHVYRVEIFLHAYFSDWFCVSGC